MAGTSFKQNPYINPGAAALLGIDLAAIPDEKALCDHPSLVFWGRGRDGFSSAGWQTRAPNSDAIMVPGNVALPTQISGISPDLDLVEGATIDAAIWEAYNRNHALRFGQGATNGHLRLDNGLSVHGDQQFGDFFIWFYGRPGPGDNVYFWGNNLVPGSGNPGTFFQWTSAGALVLQIGGTQIFNTTALTPAFTSLFADGPRLVMIGFSDTTNTARIRIDRGLYDKTVGTGNVVNAEGTLRLGCAGPASAGVADYADLAEFGVHRGFGFDDAGLIALIEKLCGDRYDIPAIAA
jgi:hypothetical protein